MTSDETPVVAVRQAISALRAGAVTAPPDDESLGALGHESRALVEQLIDVLQDVHRVMTDPQDPRARDLAALRERLAGAVGPTDNNGPTSPTGHARDERDDGAGPQPGQPDD